MKKYITYIEYLNRQKKLSESRLNGFELYYKKNYIKIGLGVVCLSIAIIPNGLGIVFYPLSFYFFGIGLMDLEEVKRKTKNKFKQWFTKRGYGI